MSNSRTYDNELKGSLFKNDRKTEDKHPEYKGSAQIKGEEFWVSAWVKTSRDGTKYMSLAFTPKEAKNVPQVQEKPVYGQPAQAKSQPDRSIIFDDLDDDLPF